MYNLHMWKKLHKSEQLCNTFLLCLYFKNSLILLIRKDTDLVCKKEMWKIHSFTLLFHICSVNSPHWAQHGGCALSAHSPVPGTCGAWQERSGAGKPRKRADADGLEYADLSAQGSRLEGTDSDREEGLGSASCFGLHTSHRAVRYCSVTPCDGKVWNCC